MDVAVRDDLVQDLKKVGHRVTAGAVGGFFWGLMIGGIGGRLAMLVLRLTTGDAVVGLESDDGFTMGTLSSSTLFLVAATSFMGAFVGIIYSITRGWLPEQIRAISTAAFLGLAGGAAVVRPDGVDFTKLSPLPLAIALFVLLPGLYGYAISRTVDRLLARPPGRFLPWLGVGAGILVLVPLGLGSGMIVLAVILVLVSGLIAVSRFPKLRALSGTPVVVWTARVFLIGAGGFSAFLLVNDVVQIL